MKQISKMTVKEFREARVKAMTDFHEKHPEFSDFKEEQMQLAGDDDFWLSRLARFITKRKAK